MVIQIYRYMKAIIVGAHQSETLWKSFMSHMHSGNRRHAWGLVLRSVLHDFRPRGYYGSKLSNLNEVLTVEQIPAMRTLISASFALGTG